MVASDAVLAAVAAEGGTGLLEKLKPEEIAANIALINENLKKIFNDADMPELMQARLAMCSYTSIAKFQTFASSEDSAKETCKALGLMKVSLPTIAMISAVILAWQTCKTRHESATKHDAEKKNLGLEPTLRPGEYITYKQQYEIAHGAKTADELPGASILEKLDKEIEDGEFKPFRLEEIVSKKEVDDAYEAKVEEQGIPTTTSLTGVLIRQQVKVKVGRPTNPEEFRKRFEILNAGIELSKLKNPEHPLLKDSNEKVWDSHVRYMLGVTVMGLKKTNDEGAVVKTPSWNLVLNYNQKILNKVAVMMNEGPPRAGGSLFPPYPVG